MPPCWAAPWTAPGVSPIIDGRDNAPHVDPRQVAAATNDPPPDRRFGVVQAFTAPYAASYAGIGWERVNFDWCALQPVSPHGWNRAAVSGADLVMVCGGDGTVREVCAELAGTGIPVGIVPAGTGNLLARNLGIPLYIRSAVDIALNGQDRAIDMVEVGGDAIEDTHFMVMAGMGFDAAIMEGVNEDIKKKIGWVAYVISGLKSLMFPAVRVEIQIDDGYGYYLSIHPDDLDRPEISIFRSWLIRRFSRPFAPPSAPSPPTRPHSITTQEGGSWRSSRPRHIPTTGPYTTEKTSRKTSRKQRR